MSDDSGISLWTPGGVRAIGRCIRSVIRARQLGLIILSVSPHPVFRLDGDDILVTMPITIDDAVKGAKVTAPTISGPAKLTIPKGASSGRVLRSRRRGASRPRGKAAGDNTPFGRHSEARHGLGVSSGAAVRWMYLTFLVVN